MSCSTAVIFLIFRRPELTAQVFEAIRQAQPAKLLIVADGPCNEEEAVLCRQTRQVTEQVNWDCEVLRNYSDANLGCRNRVSSGITWAFKHVEEAIILEDDCLPHPDFFPYCSELLKFYRNDTRIFSICGSNFQEGIKRGDGDFYFSRHADPWGWATWRRAWKLYDDTMESWPIFKADGRVRDVFETIPEQDYWIHVFDTLYYSNTPDSWFYRWQLSGWMNSCLSIWPNVGLISNIGFGNYSTNCKSPGRFSDLKLYEGNLDKLNYPRFLLVDKNSDRHLFLFRYGGSRFVEKAKYGKFYSWLLRYREFKSAPIGYVYSKFRKMFTISIGVS